MMAHLRNWTRRFGREAAGATAVEFAFILPMLLTLTLGAIDGGRAMLAFNTVEKLAKEGARFASVRGSEYVSPTTEPEVQAYVRSRAIGLKMDTVTVTTVWDPVTKVPGSTVAVTVRYPFDTIFLPFNSITFDRTATLNVMR